MAPQTNYPSILSQLYVRFIVVSTSCTPTVLTIRHLGARATRITTILILVFSSSLRWYEIARRLVIRSLQEASHRVFELLATIAKSAVPSVTNSRQLKVTAYAS